MNDFSNGDTLIFVLVSICLVLAIIGISISEANKYIKKNRAQLFDACNPLSKKCRDLGEKLAEQSDMFNRYIREMGLSKTHNCSSSVVSNAENNVVKYLMKYSNIENDMSCMEKLDFCINFMTSLSIFREDMNRLNEEIERKLPTYIKLFVSKKQVPFLVCNIDSGFDKLKSPVFRFLYVSPAGKSSRECRIEITNGVLRSIQNEMSMKLNKSGHAKAQRSAMTNDLREAIKKRDNYTCCMCGNSVLREPNLLLEVDHIIPVVKGGKTEASNLQTLCWRCNREKSDK